MHYSSLRSYGMLGVISLISFIISFTGSSLNVAIPVIQMELNVDSATMSWFVTIYILATAMFQIPFAKLSNIFDRRLIYFVGSIIFSLSCLAIVFTKTSSFLLFLRFTQGFGGALLFATGTAILANIFPKERRGTVFGLNIGSVYVGLTLGPALGGIIVQYFSWRWIFVFSTIFASIASIIIILSFGINANLISDEKFDFLGALLYISILFSLIYGFRLLPSLFGIILVTSAIVLIPLFIFWENRSKSPLIQLNIFKQNKFFNFANLTAITYYTSVSAVAFLINLYLQNVKGISPQQVGLILLLRPLAQAIIAPFGGYISDRIEHRILTTLGTGLGAISLTILIFLNETTKIYVIVISLIIGGIGFGLFSSPNSNSIMSSIPKQYYNTASALIGTMRTIGQTVSMGIVTIVFAIIIGETPIGSVLYVSHLIRSTSILFGIYLIFCLVATIFSFMRGKLNNIN